MNVIIVGAGKLGIRLAKIMSTEKYNVTLVDTDQEVLNNVSEQADILTVAANGINVASLKKLEIEKYDLLVASTDSDATNSIICVFAKKLGCRQTIARIRDVEYMEQLEFVRQELGIDLIVNPDLSTAKTIAKYLLKDITYYSGEFASGKVMMTELNIGQNGDFAGKRLSELSGLENLLIIAVSRNYDLIIPDGSTLLQNGDVIFVLGMTEHIDTFLRKYKLVGSEKHVRSAMILGGGHLGFYLARILCEAKVRVKIIEQDKEIAEKLAALLEHVLVISGDGSDISLLEEEDIGNMDAFVAVTGFDEQNLLLSLMAKQHGVDKTIAKVSRDNYTKIIDRLEIGVSINPINITANNILKFVRGDQVASVSLLLGGKGEVSEIIVTKDMPCAGKPLSELNLPKGIIIGAIISSGNVVIPKGNSVIQNNDRIVVFTHCNTYESLKDFFTVKKGGILRELWNRS